MTLQDQLNDIDEPLIYEVESITTTDASLVIIAVITEDGCSEVTLQDIIDTIRAKNG